MQVSVVQMAAGIDPVANRELIGSRLEAMGRAVDLLVLPEAAMADFGSVRQDLRDVAEPLDGPFAQLLAAHARRLGTTIVAGMFEQRDDGELPYNTLVVIGPDGALVAHYRKIHLYDSFGYCESDRLSPGPIAPVTVPIAERRVGLMTCYDLRFPELARQLVDDGADTLVVPAAWVAGQGKLRHWRALLAARAIENTVYVVAAAQSEPRYTGYSAVLDPGGSIVVEAGAGDETLFAELDPAEPGRTRESNPSLANRRMFPFRGVDA